MSKRFKVTGHKFKVDEPPRCSTGTQRPQSHRDGFSGGIWDGWGRKLFIACVHALVCIALAFGDEQCFRAGKQSRTEYPLYGAAGLGLGTSSLTFGRCTSTYEGASVNTYLGRLASLAYCIFHQNPI